MLVLDDRSQAPSGAGYALENRTVIWRVSALINIAELGLGVPGYLSLVPS